MRWALIACASFCASSCASNNASPQSAADLVEIVAPAIAEAPREQEKKHEKSVAPSSEFPADALLLPAVSPQSAMQEAHRCALDDARIDESSGLGASRRFADCLWTHNDSGDEARFYLVGTRGANCGKTLATVALKSVQASDWEDMAVAGTGESGTIYAGDIGDNLKARADITIHRFNEAVLPADLNTSRHMSTHAAASSAAAPNTPRDKLQNNGPSIAIRAERMTLRYPDGAHDAETLVALPDNRLIIVTKEIEGSLVFITPRAWSPGATQTLERIGALRFASGSLFGRLVTGGDLSVDGTRLVLRTYTDAFEWNLPPRFFANAAAPGANSSSATAWNKTKEKWMSVWRQAPRAWRLPVTRQGEAICYGLNARQLFISSEKKPSPLIELAH